MEINLLVVFFLLFFRSTFQLQDQSVPLKSPIERAALFQLRSSLGLRTKDWPIKFDPCLTWIGVLCQDGGVVAINISGFKRTRRGNQNPKFSVHSLASFTKLVSFNASGFSLPGSMPNWSGLHLRTLKFLDLRFCEIAGAIPFSIGNLSNLTELYLSDNNLNCTIPSSLSLLSHLSVLDLSSNSLTGSIPSCLGSLVNISFLDISSNHLSGSIPQEFGNLSNLQSLNLSNNNLSAPVPTQLGNLSRLITLDLSSNSLSGAIPSEFGNLRNLERIAIHNNSFIGDLPSGLWSLPDLTFFDASDNNLIGSLPNLTLNPSTTMAVFNLSHNTFYGVLTSVLKRVSSIDLSYNYLQGRVPNYLRDIASLDKNCFRSWQSQRTVKECSSFYYKKGLPFHNFGLPNATLPSPIHDHKVNPRKLILSAILTCFSLILLFVISVTLLIICSYKKRKTSLGPIPIDSCGFAYEKILAATDEFNNSNLVKTGHSGEIFKGVFENGVNVIVKRFDVRFGKNKCMVELDFFSKVSHHRLVPLLGHCLDKQKEKFIVYKYMAKGDLSSVLDMKKGSDDCSINSLDWITRLKIAIGAAECLSYLHHECSPPLVHRDVQASSILLDDKYEVRLGSLSETCIQEESGHPNRMTRLVRLPHEELFFFLLSPIWIKWLNG